VLKVDASFIRVCGGGHGDVDLMNGGCPELNPPEIPQTSITAAKGKLIYSKQTKMKTGWLKPAGS
jgi:hypothetical protein